jgi:hypothetical protein
MSHTKATNARAIPGQDAFGDAYAADVGGGGQIVPYVECGVNSGAAPNEADKSPEANDFFRRQAMLYLQTKPLPRMILVRVGLEVLQQLIGSQFELESEEFEREQRAAVVARLRGISDKHRLYKITVMAMGTMEAAAFTQLRQTFEDESLWAIVPPHGRTNRYRCLSFRFLSRIGGGIEELSRFPNQSASNALFLLRFYPEMWQRLRRLPRCSFTPKMYNLIEKELDRDSPSDDLLCELDFEAEETDVSIAPIEAKHASIRRLIVTRSVQTHKAEFRDVNAEWVCDRFRLYNLPTKLERQRAARKLVKKDQQPPIQSV